MKWNLNQKPWLRATTIVKSTYETLCSVLPEDWLAKLRLKNSRAEGMLSS
jgi:hypothetical protein